MRAQARPRRFCDALELMRPALVFLASRSTAPASHTFLRMHICGLIAALSPEIVESDSWVPLMSALAVTVDAILDETRRTKPAIRKAALRKTRKLFRTVSTCPELVRV
jgi:hypothetical protein